MKRVLWAALLLVACKGKEAPAEPVASKPAASASVKAKPVRKPIVATDVKVVRCELGPDVPEGENGVAATRHLHLAPDQSLYFFADFKGPTRLDPTTEGCGYKLGATLPESKDADFGVAPDGALKEYPRSDDSAVRKCRVRAFDKLRYGFGALSGGKFFYVDQSDVMVMDLNNEKCEPEVVKSAALPEKTGSTPRITQAGEDVFVSYGRSEWKWNREVFELDAKGALVKKYGTAEGAGQISGDVDRCGEGLCVTSGQSYVAFHDGLGNKVSELGLYKQLALESIYIASVVDVPGKGVYALVGYKDKKNEKKDEKKKNGRAELVRLDGVY